MEKKIEKKRLLALDVMRGITIAGMILVNNAGTWGPAYAPLRHAQWNGLTPTDLVFPFFMFIMGVSTYMSLNKTGFKLCSTTVYKILRRTVVIFAIGIGLTWLASFLYGWLAHGRGIVEAACDLSKLRILGVLQRLALSYGIGALIAVSFKIKRLPYIAALLIVVYAVILTVGNGYAYDDTNIIARLDRLIFGDNHIYTDHAYGKPFNFDPEGLFSTLPSIAHVLIGIMCGAIICRSKNRNLALNQLFVVGALLTMAGLLFSYALPINKKVWSPTFVLTTCGLAASLLGVLIWIIDEKGYRRWTYFFKAFGINPLYLYAQSCVLAYLLGAIQVSTSVAPSGTTGITGWFYYAVLDPLSGHDATLASCMWAILFVIINWIPGYLLQRKHIYIKV